MIFLNLFTCKGTYMIDWVGRFTKFRNKIIFACSSGHRPKESFVFWCSRTAWYNRGWFMLNIKYKLAFLSQPVFSGTKAKLQTCLPKIDWKTIWSNTNLRSPFAIDTQIRHLHRKSSLYLPLGSVNLVLKLMGTPDGISTRSGWNHVSPGCP